MKNIDEFIKNSLDSILKRNGLIYTEQKFVKIFTTFEGLSITKSFEGSLDVNSRKKYYAYLFPKLAPKYENINKVYDNLLSCNSDTFKFKYHPSEKIYKEWVDYFHNNPLSKDKCSILIEEYKNFSYSENIDIVKVKKWFESFGVKLSLTTVQFLFEFGFPCCGYLIEPKHLFYFSGNTRSLIGLLAYNIDQFKNTPEGEPLKESVVLALSRLEYFLKFS